MGLILVEHQSNNCLVLPLEQLSWTLRVVDRFVSLLPYQAALEKEMLSLPTTFCMIFIYFVHQLKITAMFLI